MCARICTGESIYINLLANLMPIQSWLCMFESDEVHNYLTTDWFCFILY